MIVTVLLKLKQIKNVCCLNFVVKTIPRSQRKKFNITQNDDSYNQISTFTRLRSTGKRLKGRFNNNNSQVCVQVHQNLSGLCLIPVMIKIKKFFAMRSLQCFLSSFIDTVVDVDNDSSNLQLKISFLIHQNITEQEVFCVIKEKKVSRSDVILNDCLQHSCSKFPFF